MYYVSNKLLGRSKALPLPTVHPSDQLPDVFSECFRKKVKLIRDDLDLQTAVSPIHGDPYADAVFDAFQPVSEEHVRNVIFKSASKTCTLDPIPTSLFIECLIMIIIIINGNFYSATNYSCMGSLAALYNDIKT